MSKREDEMLRQAQHYGNGALGCYPDSIGIIQSSAVLVLFESITIIPQGLFSGLEFLLTSQNLRGPCLYD